MVRCPLVPPDSFQPRCQQVLLLDRGVDHFDSANVPHEHSPCPGSLVSPLATGPTSVPRSRSSFGTELNERTGLHVVEYIDVIPKVPCGKILRRELKERERVRRES